MKTKFQKFLSLILISAVAIIGNVFMLYTQNSMNKVMASFTPESISITNGDFNQTSDLFPTEPNNWNAIGTNTVLAKGVISLTENNYQKYGAEYNLDNRPEKFAVNFDDQMLLINAGSITSKYGYECNLTLNQNSYYEISVYVQTKIGSTASIVLDGTEFDNNATSKILNFNTAGGWELHTIYVETSSIKNSTATLQLWLGSSTVGSAGYVLFDNASIKNITHNNYYTAKNAASAKTYFTTLKNTPAFVNNFEGYTIDYSDILYGDVNDAYSEVNAQIISLGANNANMYGITKALKLSATTPGAIGLTFADFTLNQFQLCRLSFLAKTNLSTGNANVVIKTNNPYGDSNTTYTPETTTLSVNTASLSNNTYDNWIEYAIYITGDAFYNRTVTIEFWLGSDSASAVGDVLFNNLTCEYMNSDNYATGKGNANTTELVLNNFSTTPSLANDYFNYVTLEDQTINYPLIPQTWEHYSKNESGYKYGVVNTINNALAYNCGNPDGSTASNNVLVLENNIANYQYVKSTSANLKESTNEAVSYSKFTAYVKTQDVSGVGANVIVKNENNIIAQFTGLTNTTWQKYEFYFKNGISAQNFNIYLALGNSLQNITGKAYFDNVSYKTIDETEYNNAKNANSAQIKVIDFTIDTFDIVTGPEDNYLNRSSLWTGAVNKGESTGVNKGVLDTANFNFPGLNNPDTATPNTHGNVLMIKSTQDIYYTFTNTLSVKLTTGNYYKISAWVKTENISATTTVDEENNELAIGASISLSNLEEKFIGINTYDNDLYESAWQEYVFYIKATTDATTTVVLGLGCENAQAKGIAFFDNIQVSSITESEFTVNTESNVSPRVLTVGNTDEEETDEEETTSTETNFDWVIIPSLVTALALIFAIIAYGFRNSKLKNLFTKKKKIKSTRVAFDREKTLVKDHSKRENKEKQQQIINDMEHEKEHIEKEINELDLKFEAYLIESGNEDNNKNITHEQIQTFITNHQEIDYTDENDKDNKPAKQSNELLFNRAFLEVNKQNLRDEIAKIDRKIMTMKK